MRLRTGASSLALAALLLAAPALAQQDQTQTMPPQATTPQVSPENAADPETYSGRQPGPGQPIPGEAGTPPAGRGTPGTPDEAITAKENLEGRSTMTREPQTAIPQKEAPGEEGTRRGLRDQNVRDTQLGQPSQQGTRSPEVQGAGASDNLFQALAAVRNAPPNLEGTPVPRPNDYASEPEVDWEQSDSPNPSEQTSREVQ